MSGPVVAGEALAVEIGKATGPVLYVGRMPGRKRIQLAIRDGSVVRSIAGFTHEDEAQEFVDLLAEWLALVDKPTA